MVVLLFCLNKYISKEFYEVGTLISPLRRWKNWGTKVKKQPKFPHLISDRATIQFRCSIMSFSLQLHGLENTRFPCPSPTSGTCSNSWPSSWWCHPIISSSVIPFSSRLQSFPVSGSFPMSQFFASGGQSIGASASASVLPMNIQGWLPSQLTGLISL